MAQLRVAGVCPKCGRKLNRLAPKGRATLKAACPRQGCDGEILARRVPDAAVVDPPADPQPEPTKATPRKVLKVSGYQPRAKPQSKPGAPPDVHPTTPPAPGPEPSTGTGDGPDVHPGPEPAKPKRAKRAGHPETGARRHPYGDIFGW